MTMKRDLIVFGRVAIELSRIELWEISAVHGFSQAPLPAGCGAVIREPPLIVSARLKEPKGVADLFGSVVFADPSALSVEKWRSR
jgi:hypothetical protein